MNYIFFDLEFSNCFEGLYKICEFGAIVTNQSFNFLYDYDDPMNPGREKEDRFDWRFVKRTKSGWAYEPKYYRSQPSYSYFHDSYRRLFEGKDKIYFGYGVDNDLIALQQAAKKYGFDYFSFKVIDVRFIIKKYFSKEIVKGGLESAYKYFTKNTSLIGITPHLARDDAKMTMEVVRCISRELQKPIEEIVNSDDSFVLDSMDFTPEARIKPSREPSRRRKPKSECQVLWGNFYRSYVDVLDNKENENRKVTVSKCIKTEIDIISNTINAIKRKKLIPCDFIGKSQFLIVLDEEDKTRMLSLLKRPFNGEMILYKDFIRA